MPEYEQAFEIEMSISKANKPKIIKFHCPQNGLLVLGWPRE
jgi:hypothetical protein